MNLINQTLMNGSGWYARDLRDTRVGKIQVIPIPYMMCNQLRYKYWIYFMCNVKPGGFSDILK